MTTCKLFKNIFNDVQIEDKGGINTVYGFDTISVEGLKSLVSFINSTSVFYYQRM